MNLFQVPNLCSSAYFASAADCMTDCTDSIHSRAGVKAATKAVKDGQ